MRVTRYYCPTAHETFSLLPDCLASRFPSDLDDLERVVCHVAAARSVEAAADAVPGEADDYFEEVRSFAEQDGLKVIRR